MVSDTVPPIERTGERMPLEDLSIDADTKVFYKFVGSPSTNTNPESTMDNNLKPLTHIAFSSILIVVVNIFLLSMSMTPPEKHTKLPNGDKMIACNDKPGDPTCFDLIDYLERPIYRNDGEKRFLNMAPCSQNSSNHINCIGEYLFSYNSSVNWFQRLYLDTKDGTYSLISGTASANGNLIRNPLRLRQMLSPPYNVIIGYEDVPPNDHPETTLYVRGKVITDC